MEFDVVSEILTQLLQASSCPRFHLLGSHRSSDWEALLMKTLVAQGTGIWQILWSGAEQ